MPNTFEETNYEDILISDDPNLVSNKTTLNHHRIASSAIAVKNVYDTAQGSISGVTISGRNITFTKNNTDTIKITTQDTTYPTLKLEDAKTGTSTTPSVITAEVLDGKITSRLDVTPVKQSSYLTVDTKKNGWYSVESETIAGISGSWLISKFGNSRVGCIYTAINTKDPRVVLNSNDTTNWYSPYAYWHA